VFADSRHGFALATTVRLGGQTYPAATTKGGRIWRVDGPIFHIPAAQGALGVGQPGLAGPHAYFAWGGGENSVIDMTVDGGRHWWRTFMPGTVLSVIAGQVSEQIGAPDGQSATVLVEGPTADPSGRGASIWAYTTRDGHHWRYVYSLNAVA
jgi:hypothetical protein